MDKEVAETMAYFRENVAELKKLGKDWGLSDEEIDQCVERALSIDPKDLPSPTSTATPSTRMKFAARKSWPKLRIFLWIVGILIVLIGLGALALQNEKIDHRFNQLVQPALYPLFRAVRLAAMPLHNTFDFYDNYGEECIVYNPLFSRESQMGDHICENCNMVKDVTQFTEESLEQGPPPGLAFTEPVLFKGRGQNVSLERFQTVLSDNPFVQLPMQGFKTNLAWATHIKDLLQDDVAQRLAAQPNFYVVWKSKLVWTSQIMRKVFPRPDVLGMESEMAIRKNIFISGPSAQNISLPSSPIGSFSWYVQGSGSRLLVLTPVDKCQADCSPMSVLLEPRDIVAFNCEIYVADVQGAGDGISIGFLGHFVPRDM